mgnify:FL=1
MKQKFIVFSFLFLLFSADSLFALKQKILNLPKYDRQRFHFGFILGINKTDFVIDRDASFSLIDSLYTVESKGTSGFNLQIVTNMRMGEHFDLRFLPGLAFASRNLIYSFEKGRPLSNVVT